MRRAGLAAASTWQQLAAVRCLHRLWARPLAIGLPPPPSQRPRRGNAEAAGRRIGIVVVIGPALAAGRQRAAVTRAGRRLQLVMTVGPFYGRSALGVGRDTLWGSCPCTSCLLGVSRD